VDNIATFLFYKLGVMEERETSWQQTHFHCFFLSEFIVSFTYFKSVVGIPYSQQSMLQAWQL
jgi:hypothetical protein